MSLSSGGWTHTPPPAQSSSSHLGHEASQSACSTVLMSVKVSVCHSGIRPLCLPGAGDESLRLQLSMDPGKAGEFRLALRDISGTTAGRSVVRKYPTFLKYQSAVHWSLVKSLEKNATSIVIFSFQKYLRRHYIALPSGWYRVHTSESHVLLVFVVEILPPPPNSVILLSWVINKLYALHVTYPC